MSEKIKYEFPSGLEVDGSIEELEKIASALGVKLDYTRIGRIPRGYYPSESRGLTKIEGMYEYHLRRALLKRSKDYFGTIFVPEDDTQTFLKKFVALTDDTIVLDIFNELNKRASGWSSK